MNEARERWDLQNIRDYSFYVEYSYSTAGNCGANITVWQGEIAKVVVKKQGTFDELPEPIVLDLNNWDYQHCHYSKITMPRVFNNLQTQINTPNMVIDATFDPEFGFVTTYSGYRGVFSGRLNSTLVLDSGFGYKFTNFQRLDSVQP